ncbi:MAG: radical SAM protein, partial [Deltaproteobacteria bacterium]|nr:radical SAM protein [Deltaproteobacteria bacterium]
MVWKTDKSYKNVTDSEIGTIRKQWKGRIKVALVYPNVYHIGMSNLGFQTVYDLLNTIEHVVCERAFLPDDNETTSQRIFSIESGNPLSDFDIIAFSVSFENDYPNILTIIERSG